MLRDQVSPEVDVDVVAQSLEDGYRTTLWEAAGDPRAALASGTRARGTSAGRHSLKRGDWEADRQDLRDIGTDGLVEVWRRLGLHPVQKERPSSSRAPARPHRRRHRTV
jgi:hypothetical protein